MENWYLPITIVPGLGLLILSTANIMVTLSQEISRLIDLCGSKEIVKRKLAQLKLINTAMLFFYSSIAFLLIAALVNGISQVSDGSLYISIFAITLALIGLVVLVFYSFNAVGIRQDQFKNQIDKFG